jgi:hypothetical protein
LSANVLQTSWKRRSRRHSQFCAILSLDGTFWLQSWLHLFCRTGMKQYTVASASNEYPTGSTIW